MTEQWRPVPGFEGRYEVSDHGRVRSWLAYNNTPVPRILAASVGTNGYRHAALSRPAGTSYSTHVHHLVALAFLGPKPKGWHVRHLDGDKLNNRLSNLQYGTPAENMQDAIAHGTNASLRKTHCPRGHEYTRENTRIDDGRRWCRTCHRTKGTRRVNCVHCGLEMAANSRPAHVRRHHAGIVTNGRTVAA